RGSLDSMRQTLLIVMLCLLFGQAGCWRKHADRVNADPSAGSTTTTKEDQSQALVYLDKGKELYRGDQDEEAAAAFQEAIKLDPGLAEAHFRLGLAQDALG